MHIGRSRPDVDILAAKLKDFAGPQSHLDHDRPYVSKDRRRCLQIFPLLVKRKRPFSSLLMQELHTAAEKRTLLNHFLPYSNAKNLPQTRQVAVDRSRAQLLLDASLLEAADHLGRDLIQVPPTKGRLQIPHAAQVVAMRVASAFYFDGMQKTFCKIAEQRNLLLGENSCASLGKLCLPHALNSMGNRLVSEVS